MPVPVGAVVLAANGTMEGTVTTGALVTIGTDVEGTCTGAMTGAGIGAMTGAGTGAMTGTGTLEVTGMEVSTGVETGADVESIVVTPPSLFPFIAELLLKLGELFFLVPITIPVIAPTVITSTIKTRTHNRRLYTFVESLHTPETVFSSTVADWSASLLLISCFTSMLTSSLLISESIRELNLLLGWLSVFNVCKRNVLDSR
jgi:hypothetical protein